MLLQRRLHMEEPQVLFPITQDMYMSAEIRAVLRQKFGDAYDHAVRNDDMLRMLEISEAAWREYLRLMKRVPKGEYDPVTGKTFTAIATRSTAELLYRHYFGSYPFPRSIVPVLDRALDAYGIDNISAAFAFWQERTYNHRNVMGMINYAKMQHTRDEGQVVKEVPKIFLDEETDDDLQDR